MDPMIKFFQQAASLLERYEATKANRHDDRAAFEQASAELREFRRAMRELAGGSQPGAHAGVASASVTSEGTN